MPRPREDFAFSIPTEEYVEIQMFTMDGRLAATLLSKTLGAGLHTIDWDGRDSRGQRVTSGVYFYRISAGDWTQTRKVIYIR